MNDSTFKKKNTLLNLKKSQYHEGADLALENACNLLEIARKCDQKDLWGNGSSILITSLEELSKAAYLKIKAHNPHVVTRELDSFFKNHKVKHEAIVRLYTKTITNSLNSLPDDQMLPATFGFIATVVILVYVSAKNGQSTHIDFEKTRQQGYYVNFIDAETCWHAPKHLITKEEFLDYIDIVDNIFDNVKKDLFGSELTDIHIKQYIEGLSDKNVYFRKTYKR
jgi:AbiV family abortive infection protein